MMVDIILKTRKLLKAAATAEHKESSQRFFKESIKCYGVKATLTHQISKESFKEIKHLDKKEIFKLCETLWQSGMMEESFVACHWAYSMRKNFQPSDFKIFKNWIEKYITNWASCDTFCNHTMGTFIEMYPDFLTELKKFTQSQNRWLKRAAAVSLIVPAKRGLFLKDVFEIADLLLLDEDDMVQKGYGWMLKVASQAHLQEVFAYVMKHKATMPRTALRYAIEKMPKEMKAKAMN